jgi:hypothetical protein
VCFSAKNTLVAPSKLFSDAMEKELFVSMKMSNHASQARLEERGSQTPLYLSNFTSFAKVPTPPSVNHHVQVC